jgi:hypothetical protein
MPKRLRDPFPSLDDITRRAYELFVIAARDPSQIPRCWREAETELLMRAADHVITQYLNSELKTRRR